MHVRLNIDHVHYDSFFVSKICCVFLKKVIYKSYFKLHPR
ncbi:hypothetical protein SLEP1_g57641 [Rubroshorea leprosula]|uniref:Uncharacterized protein n=1 Tax=Rubroshorea leprosula TaxID=152421 RepID=A0AAV5MPQ2_9ROSI|nr:hypothetical protein SLEP1_g57641 [Rubroshorea leprosula]